MATALIVAVVCGLGLSGIVERVAQATAPGADLECRTPDGDQDAVAVRDGAGRCVRLDRPARRVAALAPHLVENLAAAGRLSALVARSDRAEEPRDAAALPSVASHDRVDRERLLATMPDLVLAWAAALPPDLEAWLGRHNVALYISNPQQIADIEREIDTFSQLVARPVIVHAEEETASIPPARRPVQSASAVHLLWSQPLMVSGNDPLLNDVLEHCGLRNAFADARRAAITIDPEPLLTRTPDVWIVGASGWDGPALTHDAGPGHPEVLEPYRSLPGFRPERTIILDADRLHRPTRRLYSALETLCDAAAARDARDARDAHDD